MSQTPAIASPAAVAAPRAEVHGAIARAAQATGVDFSYLLAQARIESSLNPTARAGTSSAAGLYQFTKGTWLAMLDPFDRHATANLARLLILWPDGRVWEQLAERDPRAASALNHKHIVALGHDEEVRRAIEKQDYAGLLQLRQVIRAASTPELEPFLKGLELENAMDAFVYSKR